MTFEDLLAVVRQVKEPKESIVLFLRISRQIVEDADQATIASDQVQESLDMPAQVTRLPVIEEPRIEAASRNLASSAPLRNQRPGPFERPYGLVAVHKVTLMQRGHHLQRVAHADNELR